jgi:cyanophycinase
MIAKTNRYKLWLLCASLLCIIACNTKDSKTTETKTEVPKAKGALCIIGGGQAPPEILEAMIAQSAVTAGDYIAVLPMCSSEPDSAFIYFCHDIQTVSDIKCVNLNFKEEDIINFPKIDSLKNAKFIFITGGDQNKFMTLVKDTPLHDAIKEAYKNGALIGGTSAGAAVMSKVMITGNENFSPEYSSTFDKVWKGNGIYADGLGLIDNAIIDQHFIARSRYNRLLSALCDYNGSTGIGIDEETAILVSGRTARVIGNSQVVVFDALDSCGVYFKHDKIRNLNMNMYTTGDEFQLK